jgi:hypothetical protein
LGFTFVATGKTIEIDCLYAILVCLIGINRNFDAFSLVSVLGISGE